MTGPGGPLWRVCHVAIEPGHGGGRRRAVAVKEVSDACPAPLHRGEPAPELGDPPALTLGDASIIRPSHPGGCSPLRPSPLPNAGWLCAVAPSAAKSSRHDLYEIPRDIADGLD